MMTQTEYQRAIDDAISALMGQAQDGAATLSQTYPIGAHDALRLITDGLRDRVAGGHTAAAPDGRAGTWRVRLCLYDQTSPDPVADTDPDTTPGEPGAMCLRSLQSVGAWIVENATTYHGAPCIGLDDATLARRLRSLRVQMSNRRDGTGTLRLHYSVTEPGKFGAEPTTAQMLARCEIVREDGGKS